MSTTTVSIDVPIEVADIVALLTKSERKRRTHKDILRNAYVFYADSIRRCMMCQAGSECPVHGTAALRPDADRKPEKDEVDSQEFTLLRDIYFLLFAEARRERASFGAREGKALKDLLRTEGFERAKKAIVAAYGDEFWRGTATILTIARDPSRHLGEPSQRKQQGGSLQRDSGYEGGKEHR
jgi:hypothetical protein